MSNRKLLLDTIYDISNETLRYCSFHFRLKRSLHRSPIGANQRALRGTGDKRSQSTCDSRHSKVDSNLVKSTQILRSHETSKEVVKSSRQKENISKSSRTSSSLSKDLNILNNGSLQEELVKAVKNHFQENFKSNKHYKKVQKDLQPTPPKDDSSDDDIEGIYRIFR